MFSAGIIKQELYKKKADIYDEEYESEYFRIIDLEDSYTLGKHYFGVRGSLQLKPGSEIYGELLNQRKLIVPLYLVNQNYSGKRGVATLGFELTGSSIQGDMNLTLMATTRDDKVVKWQRNITAIIEYTDTEEKEYGGMTDFPAGIPCEIKDLAFETASGQYSPSGSSSAVNLNLRWSNHLYYNTPFETTQSQGSGGDYRYTDPTASKLNKHQLANVNEYHIFLFQPDTGRWGQFYKPPGYPNYYPGRKEEKSNDESGSWFWVDSILAPQGYDYVVTDDTGSLASISHIEYTITGVPAGYQYYAYVAMATDYSMQRWTSSLWKLMNKGVPTN